MSVKVFNLCCAQAHAFEGWFSSSADFDSQQQRGLVACPLCGSAEVTRLPSAPYIGGHAREPKPPVPAAADRSARHAALPTPAQLQAAFLAMAREIAASTEDVGRRFAEEARRIHHKEAPERGIRGLATPDEAQALHDEGIAALPLPFGELFKDPLQ